MQVTDTRLSEEERQQQKLFIGSLLKCAAQAIHKNHTVRLTIIRPVPHKCSDPPMPP